MWKMGVKSLENSDLCFGDGIKWAIQNEIYSRFESFEITLMPKKVFTHNVTSTKKLKRINFRVYPHKAG